MTFSQQIEGAEWVFFDFFGTLVCRNAAPEQLIERWALSVSEQLRYQVQPASLYKYRMQALRQCYQQDSTEEVPYHKIIRRLYNLLHNQLCNYTFAQFFLISYNCELQVEMQAQSLRTQVADMLNIALARGKRVGILSDFYLGSSQLRLFLEHAGLDSTRFEKIYVSSEYGKKKRTGSLYALVLQQLDVEAQKCLMIGDDPVADRLRAKQAGLRTLLCPKAAEQPLCAGDVCPKVQSIEKQYRSKPFANFGFGLYYYIQQLYQQAVAHRYQKIFFLAREGYFLKQLFDCYQQQKGQVVHTEYLYLSRLATFLPSLDRLEREKFDAIFAQYGDLSLAAFLKNLQFERKLVRTIAEQVDLDADRVIYDFARSKEFQRLKQNELFAKTYEEKRRRAKKELLDYLQPLFCDQQEIVLADIGWKGTMQDHLCRVIAPKRVIGLYFGISGQTGREGNGNIKRGLVFDRFPKSSPYCGVWEFETHLIEQLLAAPHGSTVGYEGGKPILWRSQEDKALYAAAQEYQKNMGEVFAQLHSLLRGRVIEDEALFTAATRAQLRVQLCLDREQLRFEKLALSEKTNNFGWFAAVPTKPGRLRKLVGAAKKVRQLWREGGELRLMPCLHYLSIKMNARQRYGWKKSCYRIVYYLQKGRIESR